MLQEILVSQSVAEQTHSSIVFTCIPTGMKYWIIKLLQLDKWNIDKKECINSSDALKTAIPDESQNCKMDHHKINEKKQRQNHDNYYAN